MATILTKCGLDSCVENFVKQRITPDIISTLSEGSLRELGITNSQDMMKLRTASITFSSVNVSSSKFEISKDSLQFLIETGFKVREISNLLSVSERTIYNRMSQFNLRVHSFTEITDDELHLEVLKITKEFPRIGESFIKEMLYSKDIKVIILSTVRPKKKLCVFPVTHLKKIG